MKPTIASLVLITAAGPAMAGEIPLADCPAAVQATIRQNLRGGLLDEVESYSIQGKELYIAEVEFPDDRELKIHVAADGALIKIREETALAEIPEVVRKAIDSKLGDGTLDDVEKETVGRTVTFHVEIEREGAPDLNLVIDAEGGILSEVEDSED
ncbi:MAG: hypothetical protein V4584_04635 [Verrucomicrobiota bacterium]